jgi:hypothetical protein
MASGTINTGTRMADRVGITLPFTAPYDGFLVVQLRTNTTGRVYANFPGIAFIDGYNVADGYITGTFPVKKGTVITSPTSSSNVQASSYYWTSLEK